MELHCGISATLVLLETVQSKLCTDCVNPATTQTDLVRWFQADILACVAGEPQPGPAVQLYCL